MVLELRQEDVRDARPVVVAYRLLRCHDNLLTEEALGFDPNIIGDGELLLTNTLSAIDPDRIVCKWRLPSSPHRF